MFVEAQLSGSEFVFVEETLPSNAGGLLGRGACTTGPDSSGIPPSSSFDDSDEEKDDDDSGVVSVSLLPFSLPEISSSRSGADGDGDGDGECECECRGECECEYEYGGSSKCG